MLALMQGVKDAKDRVKVVIRGDRSGAGDNTFRLVTMSATQWENEDRNNRRLARISEKLKQCLESIWEMPPHGK